MEKRILLRYSESEGGHTGYMTFYEDGTYEPLTNSGRVPSEWKLENGVLMFKHSCMSTFSSPWSSNKEKTKHLTDAIEAELFLKGLLEE